MSGNLELVKSIYAAWEKGDFSSVDWADPGIEFAMIGGLNPGRWKGLDEMAETWAGLLRAWENLRAVPEGFHELGDDRVLVFLRNEGRGRGSGIDVGQISIRAANLFTIRGGKVTSLILYWNREEAISDLGLTGSDSGPT